MLRYREITVNLIGGNHFCKDAYIEELGQLGLLSGNTIKKYYDHIIQEILEASDNLTDEEIYARFLKYRNKYCNLEVLKYSDSMKDKVLYE